MSTEVVLNKAVSGLGTEGDVVKVAEGYARNFLLPHKLATLATNIAKKKLDTLRAAGEVRREEKRVAAEALAAKLAGVSCSIGVKVGENSQLYGSVTVADILASLAKQGVELEKHQVSLAEPLKALGAFTVPVKLHPEVVASIKVWVVEAQD